jgi:LmbE family N-acetylglucosaminyl deacetylase
MPFRAVVLISLFLTVNLFAARAQQPHQPSSSEIYQSIRKLNVLGNVLYIAAHPDDENTRFIAYCANEKLFNTRYLSLTRGDGGQNLIGSELREELGIIRTQELLAARRLDGGQQSFSRANDFGFSKTSDETLRIWDRDKVLSDMVWAIRKFRPDVIVCRFPPDPRGGHGHHSASAILALEAYEKAADGQSFSLQFQHHASWQAKRIVTNTGRWWSPEVNVEDTNIVSEDIGAFNPLLGTSYNELAAISRSQHKSQGFGSTGTRGEMLEYFEHHRGDRADSALFEGITTSWERVKGSGTVQSLCTRLIDTYDLHAPEKSIPLLVQLRKELQLLKDEFWKQTKTEEVDALIKACAGLYLEARADGHAVAAGDSLKVTFELVNRSSANIRLNAIASTDFTTMEQFNRPLVANVAMEEKRGYVVPAGRAITQPFWLAKEGTLGTYTVEDQQQIHLPENRPEFNFTFRIEVDGVELAYTVPLVYRWNDPVKGESYRPCIITPPVVVEFVKGQQLFTALMPQQVEVKLTSAKAAAFKGELQLTAPKGWTLDKASVPVDLSKKGEEQRILLNLTPAKDAENGPMTAAVVVSGTAYDRAQRTIAYDHIPTQVYFPKAKTQLVFMDLKRTGQRIGYVDGAGDDVADGLRAIGYTVDVLTENDLTPANLARYDAVVTGIRFLNVNDRHAFIMPKLLAYVAAGGNVIMQYNTSRELKTEGILPFPLTLGRERVTEEDAEVRFLQPAHPVLNVPNRISPTDFAAWKQERGLYFPATWDANYTAILSMNDTGETPKDGSLLIAKHGKGNFVYTGISFFRQLPEGVPGAYRLLVNLISLEKGK